MSLIRIQNLSFAHEGSQDMIFENVSFDIDTDWKLGFIGRNGRGKTTFLRLLMGDYAYSGQILKTVDFSYFPFEIDNPKDSVASIAQTLLQQDWRRWEFEKELSLMQMEEEVLDRKFETLSHGERTRVMLCVLFLHQNGFLLIDEPTNHLDMEGRDVIGNYLSKKRGFILVSHDRVLLDRCVDHVLSVNRADIEIQQGNFSSWYTNRQYRDQFELLENEKLKREIGRLSEAQKRTANWSDRVEQTKYGTKNSGLKVDRGYIGHKAAKMSKRAKALEKRQSAAIEDKSKLLKNLETTEELKLHPLTYHSERLLTFRDVSVFYGEREAVSHVNLSILRGERIALCGKNGAGKSSILKLILGEDLRICGEALRARGLVISYVPQDPPPLHGLLSDYAYDNGIETSLFLTILRKLDFSRSQFELHMDSFSAGQKKKVQIAKSLCERAHLYVWDEPLNYIDVLSRMQIEELLKSYQPTMVFVEHDRAFAQAVATRTITL